MGGDSVTGGYIMMGGDRVAGGYIMIGSYTVTCGFIRVEDAKSSKFTNLFWRTGRNLCQIRACDKDIRCPNRAI